MVDGLHEKPVLGQVESQMLVANVECGFYLDHNLVLGISTGRLAFCLEQQILRVKY